MAMATAIHIAQGLDGKPSIWPAAAISFNPKTGEYKDIKGRSVKAVGDRMGVALDSIQQPAKRRKPVGRDNAVEDALIRRLLPTLKKMADGSATAEDDADAEQEALFDAEANDEELNEKAGIVNVSEQSKTRLQWLAINKRNAERRGLPYSAIVPASRQQARKAH
jgi:hypothetical protein